MNRREKVIFCLFLLILFSVFPVLLGENQAVRRFSTDIKLRFFEGIKVGAFYAPQIVTSSYLQPTISALVRSDFGLAEEHKQIKRIFNLEEVRLLTETVLSWKWESSVSADVTETSYTFRLDGNEYEVTVTPKWPLKNQFRLEIYEQSGIVRKNLLDTEFTLPTKNIAIFGFENSQGKPYFLSFHSEEGLRAAEISEGKKAGVVGGVAGGVVDRKAMEEFMKGAVPAQGNISPPRLIKKVDPVYPEIARKAGVEGIVILSVKTDIYGRVTDVMILKSIPLLDQAAIDAVKQWVYEPPLIDGKPTPLIFTVTVSFMLK